MAYDIGDVVRVHAVFSDESGTLIDPAVVVAKAINPAGGSVGGLFTVREAAGRYYADVAVPLAAASAGVWYYRFETTTPSSGEESQFTVAASKFYP